MIEESTSVRPCPGGDEPEGSDEFVNLVHAMRIAQDTYFDTRDLGWLKAAKVLERKVDDAIGRHRGLHQLTLF